MLREHGKSGRRFFHCSDCPLQFYRIQRLEAHIHLEHAPKGILLRLPRPRKYRPRGTNKEMQNFAPRKATASGKGRERMLLTPNKVLRHSQSQKSSNWHSTRNPVRIRTTFSRRCRVCLVWGVKAVWRPSQAPPFDSSVDALPQETASPGHGPSCPFYSICHWFGRQ